jgi:hypothetical protein
LRYFVIRCTLNLEVERGMPDIDKETKAIGEIASVMEALEEDQRGRVIRYILERFNIVGASKDTRASVGAPRPEPEAETPADFQDFASLADACNPGTDSLRALVAGYWLQVVQGAQGFDAQSANNELKNLGHPSANITVSLGTLIKQRPSLVLQLRKSGNTKQARKLYKVTESGIRKVRSMLSGEEDAE